MLMIDVQLQYSTDLVAIALFALGIIKLCSQNSIIAAITGCGMLCFAALLVVATHESEIAQAWYLNITLSCLAVMLPVIIFVGYGFRMLPHIAGASAEQAMRLNFWQNLREPTLTGLEDAGRDEKDRD